MQARMNGRTVIIGLVAAAGALAALNTFWQRPHTAPRRDPLANSADSSGGVLLPRVRPAPGEYQPTEPTPRKRAAATSIGQAPLPTDAAPAVAAKANEPTEKERSLERYALAYVGTDSLAEAVWLDAINDPTLSAHERSDLIEDLNEEGFADPKHLTPDDLPLIVNRLALIEREGPLAMDETNAAAFAEAYKDLITMYERMSASAAAASAAEAEAAEAAAAAAAENQATQLEPPIELTPEAPAPAGE
jgi:hypothetical protein